MKIKKIFMGVFLLTLLIGCLAFGPYISFKSDENVVKTNSNSEVEVTDIDEIERDMKKVDTDEVPYEEPDYSEADFADEVDSPYLIDLLQTGVFYDEEVEAKSGEKWLGFFIEDNKSYLAWTTLKVKELPREIIDGRKSEIVRKEVSIDKHGEPYFLLKNAKNLKAGKAVTFFDSRKVSEDEGYEQIDLKNGFTKDFYMNDKKFTLKVVNENATSESISKGSRLILISGDVEQIIHPTRNDRVGESWTLYWAGDLDNDGKLDFYADLSDHYNASMPTLFLSSEAEKGKLVKAVAGIRTLGC